MAFWLKIIAGCLYGWFYFNIYQTGDIVHYFQDAKTIYSALPEHPGHYLQLTFGYSPTGEVPAHLDYLRDAMRLSWRTPEYFSVRVNSLFNLLSFGHFYGNIALICLLSLMGLAQLHWVLGRTFPEHKGVLALAVFFMPSTLFWCSAVHKDALTLLALGMILYAVNRLRERQTLRDVLALASGALLMWNCRSYLLMILLPNLVLYLYGQRHPGHHVWRFFAANIALLVLLIGIKPWLPGLDILGKLAFEQEFLLQLKGNTQLPMRPIGPSGLSLLENLPMALDHIWLRSFTHQPQNTFQWMAAVSGLSQVLVLAYLVSGWRFRRRYPALLAFCLTYSLAVLLVVGWTVPALGAIVRYKSALLPLLFSAALVGNRPERLEFQLTLQGRKRHFSANQLLQK